MRYLFLPAVLLLGLWACSTSDPTMASPKATMTTLFSLAEEEAPQEQVLPYLTEETREGLELYATLRQRVNASNAHPDPLGLFLQQMRQLEPAIDEVRELELGTKVMKVTYNSGVAAVFRFEMEEGHWRFDLHEELEQSIELLESLDYRITLMREAIEQGKPLPQELFEDDD